MINFMIFGPNLKKLIFELIKELYFWSSKGFNLVKSFKDSSYNSSSLLISFLLFSKSISW